MANLGSYETQPFARPAPQVKDAGAKPHAPPPYARYPVSACASLILAQARPFLPNPAFVH